MIFNYKVYQEIKIRDFLLDYHLAKSKIYTLFLDNKVLLNNNIVKENQIAHINDIISIIVDEEIDYKPLNKPLDIIYEDQYLLIINKPKNIIIHDDAKNKTTSLSNIVANYYINMGYKLNVRFCHRLDYDTTGIIIYAKDLLMNSYINYIISNHTLNRYYLALVNNKFKNKEGIINLNIASDRHNSKKMVVTKNGYNAITNYQVLKEYNNYSLVLLKLETGRTHQIRVHMSHINHPLLGDILYNGNQNLIDRVALHSYRVVFFHKALNKTIDLKCELPSDMKVLV